MALTDAQRRANAKYKQRHLKRVPLDLQLDYYNQVRAFLDARGIAMNTYIKTALAEQLVRDGFVYENSCMH